MSSNVVKAVVRAGQLCGLATLRINFRGVGRSEGEFGEGKGEQDDVRVAVDFIRREIGGPVALAGYSFGASVALRYCHRSDHGVDHLYLIAPVPFLIQQELSKELPVLRRIVIGEMDQIAPLETVRAMVNEEHRDGLIDVIPDADHFFSNKESVLEKRFSGLFSAI
jgi:alpha/beta superfamily hydrolase